MIGAKTQRNVTAKRVADDIQRTDAEMLEQRGTVADHVRDFDWAVYAGLPRAPVVDTDQLAINKEREQRSPAGAVTGRAGNQQQRAAFAGDLVVDAGAAVLELRHFGLHVAMARARRGQARWQVYV